LSALESEINKQSFNMWLKDTEGVAMTGSAITVRVADDVASQHISEQYSQQIESALETVTGNKMTCDLITGNGFMEKKAETVLKRRPGHFPQQE
jgi:chromosomal replication initiation ATPase DnaA